MRLVFLGSPPFATPVLARVLASPHAVLALVTQPDRPHGRGRTERVSPLVALARAHGVPVLQPETTKSPELVARLAALAPDVLLVASYGEILREDLLALAPHGALNVHASLLPRHRGASPIQAAILAGDRETGVTIQRMVRALDAGDVLLARSTPIGAEETAGELAEQLAVLGGEAALEALDRVERGAASYTPQDPARITYARKLAKQDGVVDWSRRASEIERHVRAMAPWPGARTALPDGSEVELLRVRALAPDPAQSAARPGVLVRAADRMLVQAGEGLVEVIELKRAGRRAVDGAAFLRGARLEPGVVLGGG